MGQIIWGAALALCACGSVNSSEVLHLGVRGFGAALLVTGFAMLDRVEFIRLNHAVLAIGGIFSAFGFVLFALNWAFSVEW